MRLAVLTVQFAALVKLVSRGRGSFSVVGCRRLGLLIELAVVLLAAILCVWIALRHPRLLMWERGCENVVRRWR